MMKETFVRGKLLAANTYPENYAEKTGFLKVKEALKQYCLSAPGRDRVDEMCFCCSAEDLEPQLKQVKEFTDLLQNAEDFPTDYFFDLREPLQRIRVEGTHLDERELFDLCRMLKTLGGVVQFLQPKTEGEAPVYPHLYALSKDVPLFPRFISMVERVVDKFGHVRDSASPALKEIRQQLVRTSGSISGILNNILKAARQEGLVDKDAVPAMRDGRLVIPVHPGLKKKIRGIVHDESASGKTVYIEPADVVEANNLVRELERKEQREIVRILTECTDEVRPLLKEINVATAFLAVIDFIRAKGLYALHTKSVLPILEHKPVLDWHEAVHPLLNEHLKAQGKAIVPLSLCLDERQRILIISGPNAGGKSVCLKTVGLLQQMLQAGMLIPVREDSRAGIFERIFLDIGDEQSIEDDLSTYSSHLSNLKVILRYGNARSLILIDEFGSGTEPLIGGAIAEAVLKKLNEQQVYGIITTHYQNLKQYAEQAEGVVNGAMLYDRAKMQPLYQLRIGNPGSSFAVEIARKIGLPQEVIDEASDIVGADYVNADKYLQDIVRDKRYWEEKRRKIRQREKELEELTERYAQNLEQLQHSRKEIIKKAEEQAESLIKESNAKIEHTIRAIKEAQAEKNKTKEARKKLATFNAEKTDGLEKDALQERWDKELERLLRGRERKKEKTSKHSAVKAEEASRQRQKPLELGEWVRIKGQQAVGEVVSLVGKKVTVVFGSVKTVLPQERLERANRPAGEETRRTHSFLGQATQEDMHNRKLNFRPEIDVRGMRADEALRAVNYFMDDAVLLNAGKVRILHGTGTGALRSVIRDFLSTYPGVAHYADEHVQLGGAGITVVELK